MKRNLLWFFGLAIMAATTFTMTSCDPDPCKDVECGTNGECFDGACVCNQGFEGTNCDVKWNTKYIGNYNVVENCTVPVIAGDTFSSEIVAGADDTHLTVKNFGNSGQNVSITISEADKVDFTGDINFGGNVTNVVATGTYASGVLTIDYEGKVGGVVTVKCKDTMTKI